MKHLTLFFLCSFVATAQTPFSKKLAGTLKSKSADVSAIHVLNITSNKATITNMTGCFSIPVRVNDTLVFSAVQFKKQQIVVTPTILKQDNLIIYMQDAVTELDEVVLRLYNLSGDLGYDLGSLETKSVVSASTLGLPNANVKVLPQSERKLHAATANPFMSFDPLINLITGRTKMLKKRVARDQKYVRSQNMRNTFADSIFIKGLKIPKNTIEEFMLYCEVDAMFTAVSKSNNELVILTFLREKSIAFRKNKLALDSSYD